MVTPQEWLDSVYKDKNIKVIDKEEWEEEVRLEPSSSEPFENGDLLIENYPNLEKVDLSGMKTITKLAIINCPNLKELNVQNNKIEKIVGIFDLKELVELDFAENEIEEIDLTNNKKLKELICHSSRAKTNIVGLGDLTELSTFSGNNHDEPGKLISVQDNDQQKKLKKYDIIKETLGIGEIAEESLTKKITDLQEKAEKFEEKSLELERVTKKLTVVNEDNKKTEVKRDELNTWVKRLADEKSELQNEHREILKKSREQAIQTLTKKQEENNELSKHLTKLGSMHSSSKKRQMELSEKLKKVKEEYTNKFSESEQKIVELEKEIKEIREKNKDEHEQLVSEYEKLKSEKVKEENKNNSEDISWLNDKTGLRTRLKGHLEYSISVLKLRIEECETFVETEEDAEAKKALIFEKENTENVIEKMQADVAEIEFVDYERDNESNQESEKSTIGNKITEEPQREKEENDNEIKALIEVATNN